MKKMMNFLAYGNRKDKLQRLAKKCFDDTLGTFYLLERFEEDLIK